MDAGVLILNPQASYEEDESVNKIKINKDLYVRLMKTEVIRGNQNFTWQDAEKVTDSEIELTRTQSVFYLNGVLFGRYITAIKKVAKRQFNQLLNISIEMMMSFKELNSEEVCKDNWK